MVDRDVFDQRLGKLEDLLDRLRELAEVDRETFLADRAVQAQAERWLQLAAEVCLDLSQHLIASLGLRTPATYREAFRILGEEGVLPRDLAQQMEGWAGLRNVLVHLYLEVDHEELFVILTRDLEQLEAYASAISQSP